MSFEASGGKYHLMRDRKVVQEALLWYNWTLSDKRRTIGVVGFLLEEAMPMLQIKQIDFLDHI